MCNSNTREKTRFNTRSYEIYFTVAPRKKNDHSVKYSLSDSTFKFFYFFFFLNDVTQLYARVSYKLSLPRLTFMNLFLHTTSKLQFLLLLFFSAKNSTFLQKCTKNGKNKNFLSAAC